MIDLACMVAVTAMFAVQQPSHPLPPSLEGVHRIVCLGDSITQQGEHPGGYVWLVRHYLNTLYPAASIDVINAGISGHKSTDMLARFERDVTSKKPDLVFISVGVNDVWHGFYDNHPKGDGPLGIPLPAYRENVKQMIGRAHGVKARVNLLLATLIGEDVRSAENMKALGYNNTLKVLAKENSCGLVDLQTPFRKVIGTYRETTGSTQNFLTTDGVHMNSLGNQVMAQSILTFLGVPDKLRVEATEAVNKQMTVVKRHPGPLPRGIVVSDDRSASTSSDYSTQFDANQANRSEKEFDQRWCASSETFTPPQWWQVDLGLPTELTGVRLVFAPEEPDTWRYKVQVSLDGKGYVDVVDQSKNELELSEENHRFHAGVAGRFVRVLFTGPTKSQNWASLRHVQVFGKPA